MLEKNEKNYDFSHDFHYFDAHFHYFDCKKSDSFDFFDNWKGCSCAHSVSEWNEQYDFSQTNKIILNSFGLHPQQAGKIDIKKQTDFLEFLINNKKVQAIGETGFDYFTDDLILKKDLQEIMFNNQLELAIKNNLPLIIHCRKANEKLFEYSKELKKVKSVLFHSFMGSPVEALSLKKRGINAYFSFGKQLLNNNKKVISCMRELPVEMLLCETDAPFQYLKNEKQTVISDIKTVYQSAFYLRKDIQEFADFCEILQKNFIQLFN